MKDQQYHMSTDGAKERGPRTECAMPHCKHITIIATHEHSAHRDRCPRIGAHLPDQARSARGSSARRARPIRHQPTDPFGTGLPQSGRVVANGGGAAKCLPTGGDSSDVHHRQKRQSDVAQGEWASEAGSCQASSGSRVEVSSPDGLSSPSSAFSAPLNGSSACAQNGVCSGHMKRSRAK